MIRGVRVEGEQRVQSAAEADQQLQQEFGSGAAKSLPPRAGGPKEPAAAAKAGTAAGSVSAGTAERAAAEKTSMRVRPSPHLAGALGYLVVMGLASPFLELQDPVRGVLGLIILLVGIRIAWQVTEAKQAEILGPFENGARTGDRGSG